jgi:hypothetical protein
MTPPAGKTLSMDLRVGESVSIEGRVVITVDDKSGKRARITFKQESGARVERVATNPVAHVAQGGVKWSRP